MPVIQQSNDSASWNMALAARIGRRIRQLRDAQGLSAAAVAKRTEQLGHEIKRSVIAEMENGRRTTVTLADVLVLARALNTPPSEFVAVDSEGPGTTEVLPGTVVPHWVALDWVEGAHQLPHAPPWLALQNQAAADQDRDEWASRASPFQLRRLYIRFAENERFHLARAQTQAHKAERAQGAEAELWRTRAQLHLDLAEDFERKARNTATELAKHGLVPPSSIGLELNQLRQATRDDDAEP